MHRLILALAITGASFAQAAVPKSVTLSIPSNTASAVTSVAIGDAYNYSREVDGVKLIVTGHSDTNVALVATVGQPFAGVTNTISSQSFTADGTTFVFPRNIITTNHLERFDTDIVTLTCAFVTATNSAVPAVLTNASSVTITIKTK